MDISAMIAEYNSAAQSQDASRMMNALQTFFTEIHGTGKSDGSKLLGIYSTAEQLSILGLDTKAIKRAAVSRILALNATYPQSMREIAVALEHLQNS